MPNSSRLIYLQGRPKAKINKLAIYFTPYAALKPIETAKPDAVDDEYLPGGVPQPMNLLAPFANDPALTGLKPRFLAFRMHQAAPASSVAKQLQRSLRSGSRRLFRAAPAFLWRLRFASSPTASERKVTIASLDLEITAFAGSDVLLDQVDLVLSSGRVEPLGPSLPIRAQSGDQLTLLYKFVPTESDNVSPSSAQPQNLTVIALASVLISKNCVPKIRFSWITPVDLPSSRPNSRVGPIKASSKPLGPDSLPIIESHTGAEPSTAATNGILFSITGPPEVTVGNPFKWDLFIVNRSEKVHRLAIVALPKHRLWSRHGKSDSSASMNTSSGDKPKDSLAEPVVEDHVIYNSQRSAMQEPTELICLSPDVRMGYVVVSSRRQID